MDMKKPPGRKGAMRFFKLRFSMMNVPAIESDRKHMSADGRV